MQQLERERESCQKGVSSEISKWEGEIPSQEGEKRVHEFAIKMFKGILKAYRFHNDDFSAMRLHQKKLAEQISKLIGRVDTHDRQAGELVIIAAAFLIGLTLVLKKLFRKKRFPA